MMTQKNIEYPAPRTRLFLSADLVGSTSFKSGEGGYATRFSKAYPNWVMIQRRFYKCFPEIFLKNYEIECSHSTLTAKYTEFPPRFWKYLGDEVLFCTTLKDIVHLSLVIKAFCTTVQHYGSKLESSGLPLDVKGTGWVGLFPLPNITISLPSSARCPHDQKELEERSVLAEDSWIYQESMEKDADLHPDQYDFLGRDIDTGFRVAKFASPNKLALTVELAWLLAIARQLKLLDVSFSHSGAEVLKGVLKGVPYPQLSLDMERSFIKQKLRKIENALHGRKPMLPFILGDYLTTFMMAEKIKSPLMTPEAFFTGFDCGDILAWEKLPTWAEEYQDMQHNWHSDHSVQ
ncbi:hypothetical protein FAI41_04125 [Acetobacteraceae bacterium]|nr:hypothetical protein FAI41_04125 [Acetobacteraceae bacterium]